jgi:hypothetical protein
MSYIYKVWKNIYGCLLYMPVVRKDKWVDEVNKDKRDRVLQKQKEFYPNTKNTISSDQLAQLKKQLLLGNKKFMKEIEEILPDLQFNIAKSAKRVGEYEVSVEKTTKANTRTTMFEVDVWKELMKSSGQEPAGEQPQPQAAGEPPKAAGKKKYASDVADYPDAEKHVDPTEGVHDDTKEQYKLFLENVKQLKVDYDEALGENMDLSEFENPEKYTHESLSKLYDVAERASGRLKTHYQQLEQEEDEKALKELDKEIAAKTDVSVESDGFGSAPSHSDVEDDKHVAPSVPQPATHAPVLAKQADPHAAKADPTNAGKIEEVKAGVQEPNVESYQFTKHERKLQDERPTRTMARLGRAHHVNWKYRDINMQEILKQIRPKYKRSDYPSLKEVYKRHKYDPNESFYSYYRPDTFY